MCGADPGARSPQRQAVQRGQGQGQCRGERGGPRARQVRPRQEQRARSYQVSGDGHSLGGLDAVRHSQSWYSRVCFSRN